MDDKERQLQELDLDIKKRLEEFRGLENITQADSSVIGARISNHVELFLKEIKNNSLISVTAAPFSLLILQTSLKINIELLILSFVVFMINALILNIGYWYCNSEFFRSTSAQLLENIIMRSSVSSINDDSLDNTKRLNSLSDFFKSSSELKVKRETESYKHIHIVDRVRFIGIALLSSAILLLVSSIVLPVLSNPL